MTDYQAQDITGTGALHRAICDDNLAAMQHLHEQGETFDFVFVDPPYNTGRTRDAYRNRWVDEEWTEHIDARLRAAWELMATDAVMLITIDARSLSKMLVLIETVLPQDAWHQIVSVTSLPSGTSMRGFRRSNEFYIFVHKGSMAPRPVAVSEHWGLAGEDSTAGTIRWDRLLKSGVGHTPASSPGCFYPIYLQRHTGRIVGIGEAVNPDARDLFVDPDPQIATCWPIRKDGSLGRWRVAVDTARGLLERGLMSVGRIKAGQEERAPIKYLMSGIVAAIDAGEIIVTGYEEATGTAQLCAATDDRRTLPTTVWTPPSHNYSSYGSWLLRRFVPTAKFSHPKSLYAVEDALRFYLDQLPQARLLDIYAGSGTTAHALMLLNATDGGARESVSITMNELSPEVVRDHQNRGQAPDEHDSSGVFHSVLLPRLRAALTGSTAGAGPVKGSYAFPDRSACSDGLPGKLQVWTRRAEADAAESGQDDLQDRRSLPEASAA